MEQFASPASGKTWGLGHTDGPYSFLAEERNKVTRFTYAPGDSGFWGLKSVPVEISRCECDYDAQGDPLEYVKCSHYCPVHDDCESCGYRKGVAKDPSFPAGYSRWMKRPFWMCQQCLDEMCQKCGMDKKGGCKCEEARCNAHGELDCVRCAREERYRMHEEERGAIASEEAMAEARG